MVVLLLLLPLLLLLASNGTRTIRYDKASTKHWPTSWPGAFSVQVWACTRNMDFTVKSLTPSHTGLAFLGNQLPMATSYLQKVQHGCIHFARYNGEEIPKIVYGYFFVNYRVHMWV